MERLRLDDARADKEDQLLRLGTDLTMFEQVAEDRNISEQRRLICADRVLRLDDTTDYDCSAIGHQDLRSGLLRQECRVATNRGAEVRSRILDVNRQEYRVLHRDLRSNGQPQERVGVGGCRRAAQLRGSHDRNVETLTDRRSHVVLRDNAGTRKDLHQST